MSNPLPIQRQVSLRPFNTFGIDARAAHYLYVTDAALLEAVRQDAELAALPRLVLGGGSNMLFTRDFPGLVLHMGTKEIALLGENEAFTYIRASAGKDWHEFVLWTLDQGLGGLENLSLIPGTVGAAPVQNVGAYGAEVADHLHALHVFDFETGSIHTMNRADCGFGYRDSFFKQAARGRYVILDVTFALPKNWAANTGYADVEKELAARDIAKLTPRDVSDAVIAIRQRKLPDPAVQGNAGSFFKNPVVSAVQRDALMVQYPQLVSYPEKDGAFKLAAGWLVDQSGWRGKALGRAGVSATQALVLVNRGEASGEEVMQLAQRIQEDVARRFGVTLEIEPVVV
jgi:UDP-N-acetylmuramate dehydrogenase